MSQRAAARLESFGFDNICVYAPGKQDWLAFGLPVEGSVTKDRTAGSSALKDVPVCGALEKVADVRHRTEKAGWQESVVINENRVVLGLLGKELGQANRDLPVEQAMDPAPLTFRPHLTWQSVSEKMRGQRTSVALVTKPDGKLIGLLKQTDAER